MIYNERYYCPRKVVELVCGRPRKDRMTREERRMLEEKIRMLMFDSLFEPPVDGAGDATLDDSPPPFNIIRYLKPKEVIWEPESGSVTFAYEDGTRVLRHTGVGLCLLSAEGLPFLRCMPFCLDGEGCMNEPADG